MPGGHEDAVQLDPGRVMRLLPSMFMVGIVTVGIVGNKPVIIVGLGEQLLQFGASSP